MQLTSRWLPLLLKPRLALRNLELSCKPGKYLCSRNTSLPVGSSYLLIFPCSPDRNQLLENTEILFFFEFFEMTGLCSASLLLFHPPSAIRSSFQLALMPLMPLSPRAVFEVGGSYVVTGVSGELGEGG